MNWNDANCVLLRRSGFITLSTRRFWKRCEASTKSASARILQTFCEMHFEMPKVSQEMSKLKKLDSMNMMYITYIIRCYLIRSDITWLRQTTKQTTISFDKCWWDKNKIHIETLYYMILYNICICNIYDKIHTITGMEQTLKYSVRYAYNVSIYCVYNICM